MVTRPGGCPALLLVDEGFAALDPGSKALIQAKLKTFCSKSLVLVIYHTDVQESNDNNLREECISPAFFDGNLHFSGGLAQLRPLCE